MFNVDEEKNRLTGKLSEHYSQSIINIEEYERILEYINNIETKKEISIIEKIILENGVFDNTKLAAAQENELAATVKEKHLSLFSWRTSDLKSINGNGGKYTSLFGANRIMADNLPKGRTVLNVNSIFGLTEIVVPKNIRIINKASPIFAGIFVSGEINKDGGDTPELYITGKAVFGNITIKTLE